MAAIPPRLFKYAALAEAIKRELAVLKGALGKDAVRNAATFKPAVLECALHKGCAVEVTPVPRAAGEFATQARTFEWLCDVR
jgi:hypothetical protein